MSLVNESIIISDESLYIKGVDEPAIRDEYDVEYTIFLKKEGEENEVE